MDGRTKRGSVPALVRLAPRPAERAHVCTGIVFRTERGTLTLTTVTLAYSHAVWAEFCLEAEGLALAPVLEHAWQFFGGAPGTWLLESVQPTARIDAEVREFARRWAAVARPLTAADGVRWGEWALRCVPEPLLLRHLLRDLDLANRLLRTFVDEMLWRDHPQMRDRRVCEVLDEERRYLYLRPAGTP